MMDVNNVRQRLVWKPLFAWNAVKCDTEAGIAD